jgi:hypothetical protein
LRNFSAVAWLFIHRKQYFTAEPFSAQLWLEPSLHSFATQLLGLSPSLSVAPSISGQLQIPQDNLHTQLFGFLQNGQDTRIQTTFTPFVQPRWHAHHNLIGTIACFFCGNLRWKSKGLLLWRKLNKIKSQRKNSAKANPASAVFVRLCVDIALVSR